ncbi:MAG: Mur ligase family protein [Thermodesulfobacteriaceae bacterium]|nr:Mur ligase family protein [Thermodesulfobacteriaceae bacterium]
MRVYLCGLGGIGMCGVAGILKNKGFEVFGSEEKEIYPPASEILKFLEIPILKPDPQNLNLIKPEALIIGNAIKRDHPEVLEAEKLGIPLYSFPSFLEKFLLKGKKVLVCAGTHGKTTTTALLSWVVLNLGLDPSFLIGGVFKNKGLNFNSGEGEFFIIEGDEYPSAFFDSQPKFLHYSPFGIILTSLEYDHVDVYPNLEKLKEIFKNLISLLPEEGILIYNAEDSNLKELIKSVPKSFKKYSYGKGWEADFRLINSQTFLDKEGFLNQITVEVPSKEKIKFHFRMPGEYNALNALAVLALGYTLGWELEKIIQSFETFLGVRRRQEIVWKDEKLIVVDDFAHHPTALKVTLSSLIKSVNPDKIILFFELKTNSSKRKVFQEEYLKNFKIADIIFIKKPSGVENIPLEERIDLNSLKENLERSGKIFFFSEDLERILTFLDGAKTLLVFMSSASLEKEIEEFLKIYQKK